MLRSRIGALSEDAMGYGLERQDSEAVLHLGCALARQLKRHGVLASTWSRGLVVAAIDGIEICSSYVRCSPDCMERKVEHKLCPHFGVSWRCRLISCPHRPWWFESCYFAELVCSRFS